MIDKILDSTWDIYRKMCNRMKIPNWQKRVFMENSIRIQDKLEKRIEVLEKKLKDLEK